MSTTSTVSFQIELDGSVGCSHPTGDGFSAPSALGLEVVWTDQGMWLFGPTTEAEVVACRDVTLIAALRLPPQVALASTPTTALVDCVVPAESVGLDHRPPPTPATANAWLARHERTGVLVRDHAAARVLAGHRVNESSRSTERRFKQIVGLPPAASQRRLRMSRAAELLASGRRPVEVADELGFADHSHLARDCRLLLGTTPSRLVGG